MCKFVADYQHAGGKAELQLYEGANHGVMTGKPDAPYAAPAIERMRAFIRHTPAAETAALASMQTASGGWYMPPKGLASSVRISAVRT